MSALNLLDDPLIGLVMNGYQVEAEIGRGPTVVVYRARHAVLDREAAIMVLASTWAESTAELERLRQRARALSSIRHANLIEVLDYGRTPSGQHFLTTELLRGRTLASLLKEEASLPRARFSRIARQIVAGVAELHRVGLVHGSLTPSNVMLLDNSFGDRLKILDVGPVRWKGTRLAYAEPTVPELLRAAPKYVAPEQLADSSGAEPRSDLYALGVIFSEMFGGLPLDPSTRPAFEPLIFSLLERSPSNRPAAAAAVLGALDLIEPPRVEAQEDRRASVVRLAPTREAAFDEETELTFVAPEDVTLISSNDDQRVEGSPGLRLSEPPRPTPVRIEFVPRTSLLASRFRSAPSRASARSAPIPSGRPVSGFIRIESTRSTMHRVMRALGWIGCGLLAWLALSLYVHWSAPTVPEIARSTSKP